MNPYFDYHPKHWVLIPTICLAEGECGGCDCGCNLATEPGTYDTPPILVSIDFLCWTVGIII